jgi:branched-chain amino acid transport system substrate-binding protein
MYRAVPSDRAQAHALWSVIPKDGGPVSVLAADDYDAQTAARTFVAEGIAAGRAATVVPAVSRDAATAHSAGGQWSAPVALFGSPEWAARRVRDLRDRGVTGHAVGWLRMANERFIDAAGAAAEGVTVVAPAHWHTAAGSDFDVAFAARFGRRPSPLAAYAYDAANALLQAIDDGEVDPDALRDRLQRAVTHGVTGPMAFDEHGNREGPVRLAVVRRGAFAPLER